MRWLLLHDHHLAPFTRLKTTARHLNEWTLDERKQIRDCDQISFDALQAHTESAEAHRKDIFVKELVNWIAEPVGETRFVCGEDSVDETPWTLKPDVGQAYPPFNKVILPNEFLKIWFPTFLIRPPALVIPSNYRTFVETKGKRM
jgi:hypothetical protein